MDSMTASAACPSRSDGISLETLDIAFLPIEDEAFTRDPFPWFVAAREKHPWLAKCPFGYVVTQYRAIRDLFRIEDGLRTSFDHIVEFMGADDGTGWGRFVREQIISLSGAAHKKVRDVVAARFTPRQAKQHRPLMRKVIADLLEEWAPKGEFDFEEFASYFPITVMCTLIGASPREVPRLRSSMEALGMGIGMNPDRLPELEAAISIMDDFVIDLVNQRRRAKRNAENSDLLDILIDTDLPDRQLYDLLIFLFVAGYDTSKNILTFIMNILLDRPDDYARCARDAQYCRMVMDEALRYKSVVNTFRVVDRDLVYRNVFLPAGTMLYFPLSVSGRDPEAVEDAETFDPARSYQNRHFAFGLGAHICLGQYIARAQIEEGLHLISQHILNPERAGPSSTRPFPGTWGMRGLPIRFTPAVPTHSHS